ncbi:MAG: hypothetical protein R3A80_10850 [Bdellovibrionota bacterium]
MRKVFLFGAMVIGLSSVQTAFAGRLHPEVQAPHLKVGSVRAADATFSRLRSIHKIPETTQLEHLSPEKFEEITKDLPAEEATTLRQQYELRKLMTQYKISAAMRENLGMTADIHDATPAATGSTGATAAVSAKAPVAGAEALAGTIPVSALASYFKALDAKLGEGSAQKIWAEFTAQANAKKRGRDLKDPETVAALLSLIDQASGEGKGIDPKELASQVFGEDLGPNEILKLANLKDEAYAETSKFFEGITVENATAKFEAASKDLEAFKTDMTKDSSYAPEDIAAFESQVKRYNDAVAKFNLSKKPEDMQAAQNVAEGLLYSKKLHEAGKKEQAKLCFHCPC